MKNDQTYSDDVPISIRDLRKSYGSALAIGGISTEITASGVTAILGKNGAGKTTLIKCCLGLETFQHGTISIFGHMPGSKKARQSIGVMLQETSLPDLLTGEELITLFSTYYPIPLDFEEVVHLTQVEDFVSKRYKNLSGGQKKRIQFALAIVGNPKILFLDEPTTGLDTDARKALWETIRRFADSGKSVILTTHYLEEADRLADRVIVLDKGCIIEDAPADTLKARLGGDLIQCKTIAKTSEIQQIEGCISAERSGKHTVIRTANAAQFLRHLLAADHTVSDLSVFRPNLESLLSEDAP